MTSWCDQVGAKHLVIGDDFRFGRGREGDFALFERYGRIHGYSVSAMSTLLQGEARISSIIREILAAGISPQRQIFWVTNTSSWGEWYTVVSSVVS